MITSFGLPAQITTDTEFRAWGSAISNALAALGMVKTADTGQINFTTVIKPTTAQAVAGYEIWRFNDALQATAPVFFKLEYGSGASGVYQSLWLTVGTGSDGAGVLLGQVGARKQVTGSSSLATVYSSYLSGAADRISACFNPGMFNGGYQFHIERSKDAAGNNTSHGIITYSNGASSNSGQDQYIPFLGVVPGIEVIPYAFCTATVSAVAGSDIGLFPHYPMFGKLLNPKLNILTYMNGDLQALIPIPVVMYGVSRTYLPLGLNAMYASGAYGGRGVQQAIAAIMMRYE